MPEFSVTIKVAVRAADEREACRIVTTQVEGAGDFDDWDADEPQPIIWNVTDAEAVEL